MNRLFNAHHRHALVYSRQLNLISDLCVRGGADFSSCLEMFDSDWFNIQRGQTWAAAHREQDMKAQDLCADYADAGAHILSLRQHVREQIEWYQIGLTAAQKLKLSEHEITITTNLGIAYFSV